MGGIAASSGGTHQAQLRVATSLRHIWLPTPPGCALTAGLAHSLSRLPTKMLRGLPCQHSTARASPQLLKMPARTECASPRMLRRTHHAGHASVGTAAAT